jgi:hypothetical protein
MEREGPRFVDRLKPKGQEPSIVYVADEGLKLYTGNGYTFVFTDEFQCLGFTVYDTDGNMIGAFRIRGTFRGLTILPDFAFLHLDAEELNYESAPLSSPH